MSDWTTDTVPLLHRILVSTVAVPDVGHAQACYADWLGYRPVERGEVDRALALSWGAPAAAGARYVVMAPEGQDDVFIRLVETPAVPGYRPLTTFGWNAFEIIVDDVYALADKLAGSPFEHLAGPTQLQFMPSIVAMQVAGPGAECLYFTMEGGDRESSILPRPSGFVGRPFIVVAAGARFDALLRFYVDNFRLRERPVRKSLVTVLQMAQGLPPDHAFSLSAIGMAGHGNLLELDEYPSGAGFVAGPRPRAEGHLPPGNAMVGFEIADIDPFAPLAIAPPAARPEICYGGRRACTIAGPAGELVELIESP